MTLSPHACYRALVARDARYDGRFFVCITSTGIYCRPVCPARTPRRENCRFVPSAAAAQEAGYRPCLRCRPESSPDLSAWRGSSATVSRALSLIESGALDDGDVTTLAERLGVGPRHLRRLFKAHLGATPISVAQTRRVLLAKQLIHDTHLPMAQVAHASGFASLRRFNETFKQLYQRPPSELRRHRTSTRAPDAPLTLNLPYRPPYDWPAMLAFLAARALPGVERVVLPVGAEPGDYARTIALAGEVGALQVTHDAAAKCLCVRIRFPQLGQLPRILARVRGLFDLGADPRAIQRVLRRDPRLEAAVEARPGLRVPGAWDGFEIGVRAILGQQITVAAATRLAGKLVVASGTPLPTPLDGLTHTFPAAGSSALTEATVAELGMPAARARAIVALSRACAEAPSLLDPRGELPETVARLRALPGIGEWTAQYIAMRAQGQSDAFLAGDVAVRRAFARAAGEDVPPTPRALLAHAARWQPWRAYAVMHLWHADAEQPDAPRPQRTRRTARKRHHASAPVPPTVTAG